MKIREEIGKNTKYFMYLLTNYNESKLMIEVFNDAEK